jgi:hypothetical protein
MPRSAERAQKGLLTTEERERERERERRDVLTCGPRRHVASNSAKPPFKTARWSNVHNINSLMANDIRFWNWMTKIKLC